MHDAATLDARTTVTSARLRAIARNAFPFLVVGAIWEIVARSGAKVVVSSTWRIGNGIAELRAVLEAHGFRGEVIDVTPVVVAPDAPRAARWREIDAWLAANRGVWEAFVILDDEADMGPHAERHVRTELEDGLLDHHAERAIALLGAS